MDFQSIQRSLAELDERFNNLHDNAEERLCAILNELNGHIREKEELQHLLDAKCLELDDLVGQRDRYAKEKEELQHLLDAKCLELDDLVGQRDRYAKEKEALQHLLDAKCLELDDLVGQRDRYAKEKEEALFELANIAENNNLISLQLAQVQEELQHYFLLSRSQSKMLDQFSGIQKRTVELIFGFGNIAL